MTACDRCLRRTALIELLAPWIERARKPNRRRLPEVLALPDGELIEALCGTKRAAVDGPLANSIPRRARARAQAAGLEVVCRHASRYPRCARERSGRARGAPPDRGRRSARARGTRGGRRDRGLPAGLSYGMEMARSLGRDLAACDVPVVSGMAYGADSAAHEGALAAGGPTIAVMPGGADHAYPGRQAPPVRTGQGLRARRVRDATRDAPLPLELSGPQPDHGGACPDDGRGGGTEGSGSLITAGFAQDLGREVGAVPGQATSPLAAGPNRLLSEGAAVVRSASDVLDALFGPGDRPGPAAASGAGAPHPALAARLEPRLRRLLSPSRPGSGRSRAWPKGRTSPRCWPACRSSSSWGSSGVGPVETMCAVSDLRSQVRARAYPGSAMPSAPSTTPRVLSIAGSDSGGGRASRRT